MNVFTFIPSAIVISLIGGLIGGNLILKSITWQIILTIWFLCGFYVMFKFFEVKK